MAEVTEMEEIMAEAKDEAEIDSDEEDAYLWTAILYCSTVVFWIFEFSKYFSILWQRELCEAVSDKGEIELSVHVCKAELELLCHGSVD